MIDIYSSKILDIIPPNLKEDSDIIAASRAIDNEFSMVVMEAKESIILPRIDELDSELIDLLAWEMHVDFYDSTLALDIRRELVKNSLRWHQIKGTPIVIEDIISRIFGRANLQEWFDYGADPFFFRINIEATNKGVSEENLLKLERLIDAYKNTRSWLEVINIFLTGQGKMYIASSLTCGEIITVYPWTAKELYSKGKVNVGSSISQNIDTTTVYPKGEI